MKPNITFLLLFSLVLLLVTGCATTPKVVVVDPNGPRTLQTARGINLQDWNDTAGVVIDSLRKFVDDGKLKTPPDQPALLVISKIEDRTGLNDFANQIDINVLVKKIRIALNQTGKVVTSTTIGIGGVEDPIAAEEKRRAKLLGQDARRPDYNLSGMIIEKYERAGDKKQYTYIFQLSLTKNPEGFAVWEDEKTIAKQGTRRIF